MLRLRFHLKDQHLSVRRAFPDEVFTRPIRWKNLEFELTSSPQGMMNWPLLLKELSPAEAQVYLDLMSARFPLSQEFSTLAQLSTELTFHTSDKEWVFFGGSFNPWHQGHQACLDLIGKEKTVLVIPDKNPLKDLQETDPQQELLKLYSEINWHSKQYLVPTFALSSKKNPTIEWIELLRQRIAEKKLSLLIGFDSLFTMPMWKRPKDLLNNLTRLYTVSRGESLEDQLKTQAWVKEMAPQLELQFLGHHPFETLSSTALREAKKKEV